MDFLSIQRLGGCPKIDPNQAIQEAVDLASKSDVVIYIGGLTPEWESEGFDRPSLLLPGRQDELITKLSRANPNTVVCIQAVSQGILYILYADVLHLLLGIGCIDALGRRRKRDYPSLVFRQ